MSHFLKFLALLALLLPLGYGLLIEPHWVDVTRWQRQVGLGGKSLKIAQLSDLHISKIGKTEQQTLRNLKELKPDLILMTGDVIDQKDSLPALDAYLKQLPPAIKVAILGNWEYWSDVNLKSLATLYKENDVTLLVNDCLSLAANGIRLSIAGLDDYTAGMPDLAKTFKNCGKDEPVVLAEHSLGCLMSHPRQNLGKLLLTSPVTPMGGNWRLVARPFLRLGAVAGMSLVGTPQPGVICTSQEAWEPPLSRCALAHGPRSFC